MKILGFSIARWALALDAAEVGAVLAWPPLLAHLPGAPPWLLGIILDESRALPLVDVTGLFDEGSATPGATHTLLCKAGGFALPVSAPCPFVATATGGSDSAAMPADIPPSITRGMVSAAGKTIARFDGAAVIALATRRCASWWSGWESEVDGTKR